MPAHFVISVWFLRGVRCDQQAATRPDAAGAIVLTCSLHSAVMGTYSANNYDKDVKSAWEKNQGSLPGTDGIPREVSMRGREDRARWRVARPRDSSRLCVQDTRNRVSMNATPSSVLLRVTPCDGVTHSFTRCPASRIPRNPPSVFLTYTTHT